jgi:hypothetical protein
MVQGAKRIKNAMKEKGTANLKFERQHRECSWRKRKEEDPDHTKDPESE